MTSSHSLSLGQVAKLASLTARAYRPKFEGPRRKPCTVIKSEAVTLISKLEGTWYKV